MTSMDTSDSFVDEIPEEQPERDSETNEYDGPFAGEAEAVNTEPANTDETTIVIPDEGNKFEIYVPLITIGSFTRGIKSPVHENLTIAAIIKSSFNDGSWTGKKLNTLTAAQFEIIRGVFWNDDPNCKLFNNNPNSNRDYGKGLSWYKEFKTGKASTLTKRSHFGDLQFIHAMGAAVGEQPQDTKNKILLWIQTLYNLYIGNGVTPNTNVKNTALSRFFNDGNGHGDTTFKSLFLGTTPKYASANIGMRALGSCMHVIEDSYAKGHCKRENDGKGAILNFHCYKGQDEKAHSHADGEGGKNLDPSNLNSFNGLYGGRSAIESAASFLDAVAKKKPWDEFLAAWAENVFKVAAGASPSNKEV